MLAGGTSSASPGGDLAALEEALEKSLVVPLSCLSAVELAERACEVERLSSRFGALRCSTLAAAAEAVEGPGAFKELGFRHAIDFVADATKADPKVLRRLSKLGHWLIDFSLFAQAFADGELTERHIRELHKLDNHRVHHQLVESQELLIEAARDCDFSDFVKVLAYWLNGADPDGCEPNEQAAKTMCSYRKHADGSVTGRFSFDALTGQAFRRLLDLESQKLFRSDSEAGVTRTTTQRQGSALIHLMVRGSDSGGDSSITPLINLVMGQSLAESIVQQLADGGNVNVEPDHSDINRRCELDDGTPIHPRLAATALAVGRFRRIVFEPRLTACRGRRRRTKLSTLDAAGAADPSERAVPNTGVRLTLRLAASRPRHTTLQGWPDKALERADPLRPPQQAKARLVKIIRLVPAQWHTVDHGRHRTPHQAAHPPSTAPVGCRSAGGYR